MSTELPPPQVQVEYDSNYQALNGPVEVFAENCGHVLRSFGVDDYHIASTTILVTDRRVTEERDHPTHPVRLSHEVYASSRHINEDGSGLVTLYMDGVRLNPPAEVPESVLLIAGLSQRADLATLGPEGLQAEEAVARRAIRRSMLIRQGLKGVAIGLVSLEADVVLTQFDVLPTPIGWVAGGLIIAADSLFTKMSADRRYRLQTQINEAEQSWPAQLRTVQRERDYLKDPTALPLLVRPDEGGY